MDFDDDPIEPQGTHPADDVLAYVLRWVGLIIGLVLLAAAVVIAAD
jgi:hypothetical protein